VGWSYRLDFEQDVTDIIYHRLVGICPLTKFNLCFLGLKNGPALHLKELPLLEFGGRCPQV